jgi:hypothetical protein
MCGGAEMDGVAAHGMCLLATRKNVEESHFCEERHLPVKQLQNMDTVCSSH